MDQLRKYREEIDKIDNGILNLLIKRFLLIAKIGEYKKQHNLKIKDNKREYEKIESLKNKVKGYNIDKAFINKIWKIIFKESYKIEK
ncbi:MAG: chorismate mutase [Candidatus Levybacteria bacterium]|nr:chorismate mutase [Candidatus Levybacteria bacterium]